MNEDLCFTQCNSDPSTLWQRFIRWAIPIKLAHLPEQSEIPFPCGDGDVIHIDTFTSFSFWERLKILAFGTVATTHRVITEGKPGRTHTITETYISTASREKRMLGI